MNDAAHRTRVPRPTPGACFDAPLSPVSRATFNIQRSAFDVPRVRPSRHRGFTLLELLIVITIMIFITTIIVMNYFGAMRTASYSAAANDVYDSLMLTRQRACIDGSRTYLYLLDATNYVIVRSVSNITTTKQNMVLNTTNCWVLYDIYADLTDYSATTIRDLDQPNATALVLHTEKAQPEGGGQLALDLPAKLGGGSYNVPAYAHYVTNDLSAWKPGDRYGIELHERQTLPLGFYFSTGDAAGTAIDNDVVKFQGDGTLDAAAAKSITVVEALKNTVKTNRVIFVIETNGRIHKGS